MIDGSMPAKGLDTLRDTLRHEHIAYLRATSEANPDRLALSVVDRCERVLRDLEGIASDAARGWTESYVTPSGTVAYYWSANDYLLTMDVSEDEFVDWVYESRRKSDYWHTQWGEGCNLPAKVKDVLVKHRA